MRSAPARVLAISAAALSFRVVSALAAFIINAVLPMAQREQFTVYPSTHLFWDTFARWDSGWYFGIARYGYEFVEAGRSNLAFFPVYPLLMRYVALAMGGGRVPFEWANSMDRWNWHPGAAPGWQPLVTVLTAIATRPYAFITSSPQAVVDLLNASAGLALEGIGRYCAVLFPFSLWLATLRGPFMRNGVLAVFAMFYVVCLALFTKVYPLF